MSQPLLVFFISSYEFKVLSSVPVLLFSLKDFPYFLWNRFTSEQSLVFVYWECQFLLHSWRIVLLNIESFFDSLSALEYAIQWLLASIFSDEKSTVNLMRILCHNPFSLLYFQILGHLTVCDVSLVWIYLSLFCVEFVSFLNV